ncbi:MAG: amidohydrolase family protein [Bryobacteraceae bacterium]|nr:amidohydrolase family protein [Bryobacteraceae bacterium]
MIALAVLMAGALCAEESFLLRGVTVHPVTAAKIDNTTVLVEKGRIAAIGGKLKAAKGVRVIEGRGLHVYPGIIDSATNIGLSEIGSVRETSDIAEIGDFKPQLRTAVAVNPSSEHVPVIRANGITAAMALPDGGIIAGRAALMRLDGWTWEEMQAKGDAAMYVAFPVLTIGGRAGANLAEARRYHEARLKSLHDYFESARAYQKAKAAARPGLRTDLAMEAMLPVLERKVPLMIKAEREKTIAAALDWAEKERVRVILSEVREPGATLARIREKNIPVILGPTQQLPLNEDDPYDAAFTLPAELHKAGVKFAFGTFGNQFSRNLPYQAATAVAFGLPYEEALRAITIAPAEIWGVAAEMGSVETGKWADLMVTDGDPLEVRTQVKMLLIKGKQVELESRHTRLYQRYLARP